MEENNSPLGSLNTDAGGVTVEMGKPKSGTMGVSGKTNLGPQETSQILANMQAELDRRSSPMNLLLSGLQRASAWGSGGVNGPTAALTALDREQLLRDQDTRALQDKMLAIKGAQAARERFLSDVGYKPGVAQPAAMPGAAPSAEMPEQQVPEYLAIINRLPLNLRGSARRAVEAGDEAAWNAILAANEKNRTPESRNLEELQRLTGPNREIFAGQTFEKGLGPRTYVVAGKTYSYSPEVSMPGGLSAIGAGAPRPAAPTSGNIVDAESWAKANNIPVSPRGGNRTFEGQLDQYIQNPNKAALPGRSMHETGRAIDVPASARTPEVLAKLKAAGFTNTLPSEPWHFELPKTSAGVLTAQTAPTRNIAQPGTSKEDIELQQKALEKSNESFHANDYKVITENAKAAQRVKDMSETVLANIQNNNFGPGTKLGQSFMEYAQLAGVKLKPNELQKYIDNMGIETARKFMSAAEARQAMGSQFTAQEANDWLKAFGGIDSPKEYLKNFYQVRKAGAMVDIDLKNYLLRNKGREQEAYIEWLDSGAKDRIMQENVDAFKNGKQGKVSVPGASTPKDQKTVAKTGMVTDPNHPQYRKKVILYTDGTTEYK